MNSLSTEAVLKELSEIAKNTTDITEFLDEANIILYSLNEEQYDKVTRHLRLGILDIERFVKVNNCQVITNPRAFAKNNIPSDDGLLSNKIFGITREETAGIFAYIDLHGWFIDPSCYKSWIKVDKNIKNIVHGIDTYIINEKGEFVQDPAGKTGIEFLRKNIDKVKFKTNESLRRDINVRYLEANRNKMFIQKYLVIPKFYRDKNTSDSASRTVGLSGINKLYNDLIVATNALTATQDYMFDATDSMNGRVQEIILTIYNWFVGSSSKSADANTRGIQGKFGILRRANMSKTANYSSRLVISAPELKVENPGEMKVNLEYSAIPLAACMADFRDFIIYHTRKFFDNEFQGLQTRPLYDPQTGEIANYEIDSPQIYFSDDRIIKEMERYLHGYNNRFVPIEVPVKNYDKPVYMMFKGRYGDVPSTNPEAIYQRRLTWCDVFFIAASEAVKGKHSLITRFPIDKYTNQIVTKLTVSSTKQTEPMMINGEYYKYYPKIREEDIGKDTSNSFIDTMILSNLYLKGMGGDYDGDTIIIKGVYTEEANKELAEFMDSKQNYLDFGGKPSKVSEGDVVQSIYSFTKVLSDTNLTQNIKFT